MERVVHGVRQCCAYLQHNFQVSSALVVLGYKEFG
jgi:hypothetical protein